MIAALLALPLVLVPAGVKGMEGPHEAPAPIVETNGPLIPRPTEDSDYCYWIGELRGDGVGRSFYVFDYEADGVTFIERCDSKRDESDCYWIAGEGNGPSFVRIEGEVYFL